MVDNAMSDEQGMGYSEQTALERQNWPCMHLAHHELESIIILIFIVIIVTINAFYTYHQQGSAVYRFKEMREANQAMAEMALNLYRECLRKVLMQRGGYECQETEGSFMLSFYNCLDAVQFCVLVTFLACASLLDCCIIHVPLFIDLSS